MATALSTIRKQLSIETVMQLTGCSHTAAQAELRKMGWDVSDAIQSLGELSTAKRVAAGAAEALQCNIDVSQRELNRRAAEGEDVSHLRVCQATAAIVPAARPALILNQAQAEAVYSAMCALNNVGGQCADLRIADQAIVTVDARGAVKVHGPDDTERYADQSAFATAYGLQQG